MPGSPVKICPNWCKLLVIEMNEKFINYNSKHT